MIEIMFLWGASVLVSAYLGFVLGAYSASE